MGLAVKSKTITKSMLTDVIDKIKDVEHPFFVLYFTVALERIKDLIVDDPLALFWQL